MVVEVFDLEGQLCCVANYPIRSSSYLLDQDQLFCSSGWTGTCCDILSARQHRPPAPSEKVSLVNVGNGPAERLYKVVGSKWNSIYSLFAQIAGEAQLGLGHNLAVMATEKVIPIHRISIGTVWRQIQMNHKTGKDEPQPKVRRPDVALVVIVQAPC